ncbi:phosphoglycerate dehydrogenase [Verrucomicrobiales bacterium]|nr:phosphoglycerate dehydrogenase [Verrucomicrobiales bacterium]MDC0314207.1 phosphoglycerate dehydrogenase [bacterium]MDC0258987.1 phosphoglycerate dehydrogenase [Verrucomicrobiales bacterium]MDC0275764.1 phosphoglycerate dehydrogenase [Verrucomicrobiales bacterium]MDC0291862.1 phosphoglycerate dehydrogenase [Verrucomicrobiales bacterium]
MTTRILLTTTSYQDTPGPHHNLLESSAYEVVRERGPLPEEKMLELAGEFDAFLCGDDAISQAVIEKSLPRLKVISKYGIGLDKIDMEFATAQKIPVLNTPGVNHTTVAEHTFGLLLCLSKQLVEVAGAARNGEWRRLTGHEIMGKKMGIIGLGRIGKEVAIRANAFAMPVMAYDPYWDEAFATEHNVTRCESMDEVLTSADVISLHCFLDKNTHGMINAIKIEEMQDGAIILNCARGELVETDGVVEALKSGKLGGYGADVLDEEPPPADHPLLTAPNCVITSHIGSRTYESVERQAMRATNNLINFINGDPDFIQANKF